MRKITSFLVSSSLVLQVLPLAVLAQDSAETNAGAVKPGLQQKREAFKQEVQQKRETVKQNLQEKKINCNLQTEKEMRPRFFRLAG